MTMATRRIGKNKYQVRCRHEGRQVKRTFDNKWDAADFERMVVDQGKSPDEAFMLLKGFLPGGKAKDSPRFEDYVETWLEALEEGKATLDEEPMQPGTLATYRVSIKRVMPFLGTRKLSTLQPSDWQDLKNYLRGKYAAGSANNALRRTKQMLRYAHETKVVEEHPFQYGRLIPDPRPDKPFWRKEEVSKFLATVRAAREDHFIYFLIALKTAMRRSELFGLRKCDLDFENKAILVRRQWDSSAYDNPVDGVRRIAFKPKLKNGQPFKRIPMSEGLATVLADYSSRIIGDETNLFYFGVAFMKYPGKVLRAYAKQAGVTEIKGHGTRDSAIGNLKIAGVQDWHIAQIAGCSVKNLTKYGHLDDRDVREAVNYLD